MSFPHLKHLKLDVSHSLFMDPKKKFTLEKAVNLSRANRQLLSLEIEPFVGMRLDELLNTIKENKSELRKLVFGVPYRAYRYDEVIKKVEKVELHRLAKQYPSMQELYLTGYQFTAEDAIYLTGELKSIKHLTFQVKDPAERDRLLNQLDSEWQHNISTIYENYIIISLEKQ